MTGAGPFLYEDDVLAPRNNALVGERESPNIPRSDMPGISDPKRPTSIV
jgi:hypothetical protein